MVIAHKRGVKIQVILDQSQKTAKYSSADFVRNAEIPTFIDSHHAIAHNKIIIIDGQTVLTGSFNFTKQAENSNAENLLVIRDTGIAEKYTENWNTHVDHSEAYEQREKSYSETGEASPVESYVASKNSKVYHKAGCKSVESISEKNRIYYTTKDEANEAGKKPCAECNSQTSNEGE